MFNCLILTNADCRRGICLTVLTFHSVRAMPICVDFSAFSTGASSSGKVSWGSTGTKRPMNCWFASVRASSATATSTWVLTAVSLLLRSLTASTWPLPRLFPWSLVVRRPDLLEPARRRQPRIWQRRSDFSASLPTVVKAWTTRFGHFRFS